MRFSHLHSERTSSSLWENVYSSKAANINTDNKQSEQFTLSGIESVVVLMFMVCLGKIQPGSTHPSPGMTTADIHLLAGLPWPWTCGH